jgi:UTP--glucose-1-phosphate uridylyltransferase
MLPAAKAVPKEMLPILDKPTIQYVVEEAAAAGVCDVAIVTSREKKSIEDHFDRFPELESRLEHSGKESYLQSINDLMNAVRICSIRQREQRGLGHAVLQAREHVGSEPFLCLLGDTIFSGADISPAQQLIDAYESLGTAVIGLQQVQPEKVERYGIVAGEPMEDGLLRITDLVEKPRKEKAPSNLAIAARYLLTPGILACLDLVEPGKGGEIQLTDAIKLLLSREPVHGVVLKSMRHDIGDPAEWLKTNLIFASRNDTMWSALAPTIQSLASTSRGSVKS